MIAIGINGTIYERFDIPLDGILLFFERINILKINRSRIFVKLFLNIEFYDNISLIMIQNVDQFR